jgi:branched-chain amino acid aminotransferase
MVDWSKTWTWLDGEWFEGNVPIIGPRTHSFWLGSSVFDGARHFEGVAPDLDLHCARINRSARAIGMEPTVATTDMVRLALEGCAKFSGDVGLYIRPNYWSEDGGFMGVPPDPATTRFALCIYELPMPGFDGFSATTTQYRRPLPETAVVNAKAGCLYPNGGRAINEAKAKGFDNAVLTDALGNVCELATANLFIVKDGVVKTPAATGVYLAGITRARLIGLLRGDGYDVREASLRIEDLYEADEFFASGNYGKVTPVNRFEDRLFEPGPVTRRARDLYWRFAHGK